ncbi:hypothetical protein PMAYCL1PPCAC_33475, partial [Pristionchus mayeri]
LTVRTRRRKGARGMRRLVVAWILRIALSAGKPVILALSLSIFSLLFLGVFFGVFLGLFCFSTSGESSLTVVPLLAMFECSRHPIADSRREQLPPSLSMAHTL